MTKEEIHAKVTALCATMSIGTAYTKAAEELGISRTEVACAYLNIDNATHRDRWLRSMWLDTPEGNKNYQLMKEQDAIRQREASDGRI